MLRRMKDAQWLSPILHALGAVTGSPSRTNAAERTAERFLPAHVPAYPAALVRGAPTSPDDLDASFSLPCIGVAGLG